jgi:ketosteroid isomerase-like protein
MSAHPLSLPDASDTEFQQLLDDWAEAIVANDAERIGAFAAPEWQLVDTGGIISRQKFLDVVGSGDLTHETMSFDVLSVQVHDHTAVVVAHGRNTGHWQGQAFSADEWATDFFVWQADRWQCTLSALTPRRL